MKKKKLKVFALPIEEFEKKYPVSYSIVVPGIPEGHVTKVVSEVSFKLCQGLFLTFIPTPCWGHAPSREAFSAAKLHNFKSISKFYCQLLRNLSPICQWHSPFLTDVAVS